MYRYTLIAVFCLLVTGSISADGQSMTAYELAETRLLAEWVGLADEQHTLATVYYKGDGVTQDYAEALRWYRKAAEQGHADSQYQLAVMYDKGEGEPRDYAEAVKWYRHLADQGLVSAQYHLGTKYAEGLGVPQNYAEAYVWFSLSAASGYKEAIDKRDTYAAKLSREEISVAQQRAASLFEEIQQRKTEQAKDTAQ